MVERNPFIANLVPSKVGNVTTTGTQTLTNKTLVAPLETCYKATSTDWSFSPGFDFSVLKGSVQAPDVGSSYYFGNYPVNIRGNSTTTLASVLGPSQSITIALWMRYSTDSNQYPSSFLIDGSSVTVLWLGGTAPSSLDATFTEGIISLTLLRQLSNPPIVLGSFSKFKA